ncbi:acyltransferase [Melaminivora sp.]|uniref:acyltransferase family protein n=1 Tax=Melaminivora sp. TaxID=1933032 RepID=UPI0028AEB45F|nr:acyltransferase [Melaminivora sp.]
MAASAEATRQAEGGQLWVVEAWRGLAALLVLWVHWGPPLGWAMGPLAFGFTGVDLFFVLSGFVFAPTVMAGHAPALAPYALRRLARIYPAYLVALALYAWLAWRAGKPLLYIPEHLLMAHMQSREMTFYYNPVFWSLPSEVAFYGLVPLLAWGLGRARGLRWPLLFALALALRLAMVQPADGEAQNWAYIGLHHIPGLLVEFFLGIWAWQRWQQPLPGRHAVLWALAALAGWLALAALWGRMQLWSGGHDWRNGQIALAAAVCFALALRASLELPAPRPGSLAWHGARWGGKLSYGLYLLHIAWLEPARALVAEWGTMPGSAAALAGLVLSCWALHAWVEEPARSAGRAWSRRLRPARRHAPGA